MFFRATTHGPNLLAHSGWQASGPGAAGRLFFRGDPMNLDTSCPAEWHSPKQPALGLDQNARRPGDGSSSSTPSVATP